MLDRIQRTLSELYDVEIESSVRDFVCDAETVRAAVGEGLERGEVLLVAEEKDGIAVGLYVCPHAVDALDRHDGDAWLDERGFEAACLATEGVSHFLFLMFRAENDDAVSQLELELQAEVDKYAAGLLAGNGVGAIRARSRSMRWHLFERARFLDPAHTEAGQRYRKATEVAARYAAWLEHRFVVSGDFDALRTELRRFYRLGLREKLQAGDG
jgi:hypothetical protein